MKNRTRCSWVNSQNEPYVLYHDNEWGVPVLNDKKLFEFLILEGAQAGLSWETILKRREGYRKAFANWNIVKVSQFNEVKIQELLENSDIIRNKLKVRSAVKNAQSFIEIQKEFGSFSKYLWKFVDQKQIKNSWKSTTNIPTQTELAQVISNDLKKRGMSFVGPTIIYAYMQATGLVNDHTTNCFRYNEI
jgi:DNA-3-methyladenine glycosylase I